VGNSVDSISSMRRTLRQAFIALLVTLAGIELILQLVSAFGAPFFDRTAGVPGSPDAITILCVGDSHTYGAPLPEAESYPAQLQALLAKRYPSHEFRVVNLGMPGVNSAFVAARVERQLLQIRPRLLLVSAGLNNRWNDLWTAQIGTSGWDSVRRLLLNLKLFRLAAVATETAAYTPGGSPGGRWNHPDERAVKDELRSKFVEQWQPDADASLHPSDDHIRKTLEHDMKAIVTTARALGIPVMWYRYPSLGAKPEIVNNIILENATELGVPVMDAGKSMARALAAGNKPLDLFVNAAGPHPTQILYAYIVEDMLPLVATHLELDDNAH
jgi:hypothetical protein